MIIKKELQDLYGTLNSLRCGLEIAQVDLKDLLSKIPDEPKQESFLDSSGQLKEDYK